MILLPNNIDYNFFNNISSFIKPYLSEVILITNTNNEINLVNWIHWHLYVIGFDHIIIVNNNSPLNISLISQYIDKTKIEVIDRPGSISQSQTYTELVNSSKAIWAFPIDDDEYIWISPTKYNHSINNLLMSLTNKPHIKYGFTWRHMFSKNLYSYFNKNIPYMLNYTYSYKHTISPMHDWYSFKTCVNTNYKHLYSEITDLSYTKIYPINYVIDPVLMQTNKLPIPSPMGTVHNPITFYNNKYYHAYNLASDTLEPSYYSMANPVNLDDVCILHFKYRTYEEWYNKVNNSKVNRFNDLPKEYFQTISNTEYIKQIYNNNIHFELFDEPYELFKKLLT